MNPDYLYWINKKRADTWKTELEKEMDKHINACRQRNVVIIFTTPNRCIGATRSQPTWKRPDLTSRIECGSMTKIADEIE